jgi:hypothetical protein
MIKRLVLLIEALRKRPVFLFLLIAICWFGVHFYALRAQGAVPESSRTYDLLLSFQPHFTDADEPEGLRKTRMRRIADAIDRATEKDGWVNWEARRALVTLAKHESHLARYVYENRCAEGPRKEKECDGGKATGIFQIHANDNNPKIPLDVESQAVIAAKLWWGSYHRCLRGAPDPFAAAYAAYGSGGWCAATKWAESRAAYHRAISGKL